MAISIKTYNEVLGAMIRKIVAETPLNDINKGSVLLTLLEAAAANDFENNVAILSVLDLFNIDSLRDSDLDNRAADYGLSRATAQKATGFITVSDSFISKRSAALYPLKPVPIKGATVIHVTNASSWKSTGTLYIGRGTESFEGPIKYTSITNNGSFYSLHLESSLRNDHLLSDTVIDAQGTTDRKINAGTVVAIPANNKNPEIRFFTLRDAVIPAGEDKVDNVEIVASYPGSSSNAGINTITAFLSAPFVGAKVTNTTPLTNGKDIESDEGLRNRIKSYAGSLARGTKPAILSAILNVSDAEDNKQVASAVVTEPTGIGAPSIIYIDDGSGLQPSFKGQPVDKLLANATGTEEFLQLANYPLPRPQVVASTEGPYPLFDKAELKVSVDGTLEVIRFSSANFTNITAATSSEIAIEINNQAINFKCRLHDNSKKLLIYPVNHDAESIQVIPATSEQEEEASANRVLNFSTKEFSYIKLYKNGELLKEKQTSASLTTNPFANWNIVVDSNIIISVDGTPPQDRTFTTSDIPSGSYSSSTIYDFAAAFNKKFAGMTAHADDSGQLRITSNRQGSTSSLKILGGSLYDTWFDGKETSSTGQDSGFQLNRQNGNLRILGQIMPGDTISAGLEDTKGSLTSFAASNGKFNLATDSFGRESLLVVVADAGKVATRTLATNADQQMRVQNMGDNTMRIYSSSMSTLSSIVPGDFVYLTHRIGSSLWLPKQNTGLFKVLAKGEHTQPNLSLTNPDCWIEVHNIDMLPATVGDSSDYVMESGEDLQAFTTDGYPQIWNGTKLLETPAAALIEQVVSSLNTKLSNVTASVEKTNYVKLTSTTEEGGSIAVPVSCGNARLLFATSSQESKGAPAHVASSQTGKDLVSFFKRTEPSNTDVFLGRYTYTDVSGTVDNSSFPGVGGVDAFADTLQSMDAFGQEQVGYGDYTNITSGSNKGSFKPIRQIMQGNMVGTQFSGRVTSLQHASGSERVNLIKMLEIADTDNVVAILDQDSVSKTVDISMSRTGRVNSGSQYATHLPTTTSFSAWDSDNEEGIDFGNAQTWDKSLTKTEFKDYAVWFRSRNWYATEGALSGKGAMLLRAKQYGPNGDKLRFNIQYPSSPEQEARTRHLNYPTHTLVTYFFGSSAVKTINGFSGAKFEVHSLGENLYRFKFLDAAINLDTVVADDILSIASDSGVSLGNQGAFRIVAVNGGEKYVDVYSSTGCSPTFSGSQESVKITATRDYPGVPVSYQIVAQPGQDLDGKYFIIGEDQGKVAYWFNTSGSAAEPIHGADRSVMVGDVTSSYPVTVFEVASARTSGGNAINSYTPLVVDGKTRWQLNFDLPDSVVTGQSVDGIDINLGGMDIPRKDDTGTVVQNAWWNVVAGTTDTIEFDDDYTSEDLYMEIQASFETSQVERVKVSDSADQVALKVATHIENTTDYNVSFVGSVITLTANNPGPRTGEDAGDSGFTVTQTVTGVDADSVKGKYLVLNDGEGTVKVWFDVDDENASEPLFVADRSIVVNTITSGMSADRVAQEIGAALAEDDKFLVSVAGNEITVMNTLAGDTLPSSAGTTSFAVTTLVQGQNARPETITVPSSFYVYELKSTSVKDIVSKINETSLLSAVAVSADDAEIEKSTVDEVYTPAATDYSASLGHGHIPGSPSGSYVSLYDGENWVAKFDNANPNFILKKPMEFAGSSPSMYRLNTCKNADTEAVGEFFKLVPRTAENVLHQLTNKALNQLSIIGDISLTSDSKKLQIKSKQLGSEGAIEVVGGKANSAHYYTFGDAGISSQNGKDYIDLKIPAYPSSLSVGDMVKVESDNGAVRQSKIHPSDSVDVVDIGGGKFEYRFNALPVNISSSTTVTITDVSSQYGRAGKGAVWRWSFSSGVALSEVKKGDSLVARGLLPSFSHTNTTANSGDDQFPGFTIVNVDYNDDYVDVVNPNGNPMPATQIGSSGHIEIFPGFGSRWTLKHSAPVDIGYISVTGTTAVVTTASSHRLNSGQAIELLDSDLASSAVVSSVISGNQFSFILPAGSYAQTYAGGKLLKQGAEQTRYRVEKLGFNHLVKISHVGGDSPNFVGCGVAVDDIVKISGATFRGSNTGTFRVVGVANSHIIIENANAIEQHATLVGFNNDGIACNWASNNAHVTGTTGVFKNVKVGDWVKKSEDEDSHYSQVIAMNATADSATEITIGRPYPGTTSSSQGIAYDQNSNTDTGVVLKQADDIAIYEGDTVRAGDIMAISELVDQTWFKIPNCGTFKIEAVGTRGADFRPYFKISNPNGIAQSGAQISTNSKSFSIMEGASNKFVTYRKVEHVAVDEFNAERRVVFLSPADRAYKMSEAYRTKISSLGKLGFDNKKTLGADGYTYYTGLVRTVQRIVDGFEPDSESYPGRKAVGGLIEILPPLIQRVKLAINVTTSEGINLNDVSNEIKSSIINYVNNLGVGEDVILSNIIVVVKGVKGVEAVTFLLPSPSTERVSIADNEKAFIEAKDISVA